MANKTAFYYKIAILLMFLSASNGHVTRWKKDNPFYPSENADVNPPVAPSDGIKQASHREDKDFQLQLLPLRLVFSPDECEIENSGDHGMCVTKLECMKMDGEDKGNCQTFGTCCSVEKKCGDTTSYNNTFLINNDYPDATTSSGDCSYTIKKVSDNICQLRFDFVDFVLLGPDNSSICVDDAFSVDGLDASTTLPDYICGENIGQHVYVDFPEDTETLTARVVTTTDGFGRSWRIKVSQISCTSQHRAPHNCLQYFRETSGTINSFNFQTIDTTSPHLADLSYLICIDNPEGYCSIQYSSNDFTMSDLVSSGLIALGGDVNCQTDFVSIFVQDFEGNTGDSRFCGTAFNDTETFARPFQIRVRTDDNENGDDLNRGFSINYQQVAC